MNPATTLLDLDNFGTNLWTGVEYVGPKMGWDMDIKGWKCKNRESGLWSLGNKTVAPGSTGLCHPRHPDRTGGLKLEVTPLPEEPQPLPTEGNEEQDEHEGAASEDATLMRTENTSELTGTKQNQMAPCNASQKEL